MNEVRPPQQSLTAPERSAPLLTHRWLFAALWTAVFVLGTSGVAAAARYRESDHRLRAFCQAYFADSGVGRVEPGGIRASDLERPEVQAGMANMEHAFELAPHTGSERIATTFQAMKMVVDDAMPGLTPDEVQAKAERFGAAFMASFTAAVEVCHGAGFFPVESR